jgi:HlyD family secretion protein
MVVAVGGIVGARALQARRQLAGGASGLLNRGEVTSITAITTVETSGNVQPQQSSSVAWGATGRIARVLVKVGDHVKAGDPLMTLDPASVSQNVILARADLISAQKAQDDLLHPSALAQANAQKAVVDAQDALTKAQKELRNAQNPIGQDLYDSVADAQLALETAQANLQLTNVSSDATAHQNAVFAANYARRQYEDAQAKLATYPGAQDLQDVVDRAYTNYQIQLNNQLAIELRMSTDQANKADVVAKAQDKHDTAVANLNSALKGPDASKVTLAQAKVAVAEATLAEAQKKLDKLSNPDPNDVATAQVRVQAAQISVNALTLTAPFDGEVLVVNYQPGDSTTSNQAAVVLVNREQLHVDVSIDESDIGQLQLGQAVTATFDSMPDLTLAGDVTEINPVGAAVQGLIKYNVRINLTATDPRVLLGMTANVAIITQVQPNALAVPLDAVQLDAEGEFVNRLNGAGQIERVNVASGETQGDLVVITGDLQPGDQVQLIAPVPTNNGSPFGPG